MNAGVVQLGYVSISSTDVPAWLDLGELVGCQVVDVAPGVSGLRIDADRMARIYLHDAEGPDDAAVSLGWEAPDSQTFEAILARLDKHGVPAAIDDSLARLRSVRRLATFRDPDGLSCELYWGARTALRERFRSPHGVEFRAGVEGFGHATVSVADIDQTVPFYQDVLGLGLTEVADVGDLSVFFLHANDRHHSMAITELPSKKAGVAHLMLEVVSLDHMGSIRDRLMANDMRIERDLGRHPTDGVISMYIATADVFELEIGWGSIALGDDWATTRYERDSWSWGHRSPHSPGGGSELGEVHTSSTEKST
ncbi:MAG: VOC family protein [Acidimicrobiales bacterium]